MWLAVFFLILVCERVCVREAETVTSTQMHADCDTASHSHDLQFLLDYQQMEIRGEYAAAVLIADRSGPRSWVHGAHLLTALYNVVCLARNKRAAACSVIRED